MSTMRRNTDGSPKKGRFGRLKVLTTGLLVAALFLAVYFGASSGKGALPPMPEVPVDAAQMAFAVERLERRAKSVKLDNWHKELIDAFEKLNIAEAQKQNGKTIAGLHQIFLNKSGIPQTAQKARYLLLGDYLAVRFEAMFKQVLAEIGKQGVAQAMMAQSTAYQELVKLSGNFLQDSIHMGLVRPDGTLRVAPYVPQILFRKRWRALGEIPFRYRFLEIESLADSIYQLNFGSRDALDMRLRAIRRIQKAVPDYDDVTAKALVYYEAKETAHAIEILKNALKAQPDNFTMNQFLLFLSNDKQ